MGKADEALADVRRWLCDSLSDGDAGKVCGMLSVVSRRIAEIEEENAELRELTERAWKAAERLCQAFDGPCRDDGVTICKPCPMGERDEECVYGQLQRDLRELGVDVDDSV